MIDQLGFVSKCLMMATLIGCGSSGDETKECAGVVVGDVCVQPGSEDLDSNWHPDPDGDGVPSSSDLCPNVYDREQGDADSDGIGDFCDSDFVSVVEGGPVVDLRAQHVTPYGGWFSLTSPATTQYGKDYVLAWSTSRDAVASGAGVAGLDSANRQEFRSYSYFGHRLMRPLIVTDMQPDTTYYVSVTALDDDDEPIAETSNVVEIKTSPAPSLGGAGSHPRAFATSEQIQKMRDRKASGDTQWSKWEGIMGPVALSRQSSSDFDDFELCISAALLFHATGEDRYRDAALNYIATLQSYWESNDLDGNQLRWADSILPACADLMWNELSGDQRNGIVSAFLEDDENADLTRLADTDEYASITRSWVVDGLVACDADGIDGALSDRGCALLDKGLRSFYGVQLVKVRRDEGFFAQSGGNLPDGLGYGWGTAKYWMHTLHVLNNVGGGVEPYATWVWNNFLALEVYPLTPMRRGFATFGDLDSYDNFELEPNSLPLFHYMAGLVAMQMGLMEEAGLVEQAGHASWHLDNMFPDDDYGFSWALLLFNHDGITRNADEELPTAYHDSGMGMFYDRTGWGEDDSFFVFRAGWSGVDHNHEDLGSFQLYRKGVWITHEALGYNGPAAGAGGHNVPQLEVSFEEDGSRVGQFSQDAESTSPITRTSSSNAHSFVAANLLGAYSSGSYHSFLYEAVERHILWIKPSAENGDDRLIVYDRIDSSAGESSRSRGWQMHIDQEPVIDESHADVLAGDTIHVDLVHPQGVALAYQTPEGSHSNFPGEVYTGRLQAATQETEGQLRYLTVIRGAEAAESVANIAASSEEVVGVLSGSDLVLFPRTTVSGEADELSVEVSGDVEKVWWTGLEPNTEYSVEKNGSRITLSKGGSLLSDEAGIVVW